MERKPHPKVTSGISRKIREKRFLRALTPAKKTENTYVSGLVGVFDYIHQTIQNYVFPQIPTVARADAISDIQLRLLLGSLKVAVRTKVIRIFNDMADDVGKDKLIGELVGIDPVQLGITHVLDAFRDENIRLVENAAQVYADQVREIFSQPGAHLLRVEELKKELLKRADVSKARAELIARDQVLKLNSNINKTRQTKAGITQYVWSTSKDERVRSKHAELEGQTFDWNHPPQAGQNGEELHPGEDFQCRCIGVPVIPELEGI